MEEEKLKLMIEKEKTIKAILADGTITYGMAKSIIQRVEVELLREGDTYLKKANYRDVSRGETAVHDMKQCENFFIIPDEEKKTITISGENHEGAICLDANKALTMVAIIQDCVRKL